MIMIDAKDGRVSKVGRSTESFSYDLEAEQLVPRPEGPVLKEKEFVYVLTLDDLDRMIARRRGGWDLLFTARCRGEGDRSGSESSG